MTATYAFRDSDTAAARLELVGELFEPTTRAFLSELGRRDVELALDLGCGPGHATRLIAEELAPRRLVGVDTSSRFLEVAGVAFETLAHDVAETPFPLAPADLLFCRFLLSHVGEPARALAGWVDALAPGGRILLEEVEWIRTADRAFGLYLATVRTLLAARGHRLEIGPLLDRVDPPTGLRRRASRVVTISPDADRVAWMFLLNLRAWSDDPLLAPETVAELEAGLAGGPHGPITWGLRQIAWEAER